MTGRAALLSFVASAAWVQTLPALPQPAWRWAFATVCMLAAMACRRRGASPIARMAACCTCAACLGAWYAIERGQVRLSDALAAVDENQVARVTLRVAALAEQGEDGIRFDADILQSRPMGVPTRVRVAWRATGPLPGTPLPVALPGQVWRMALLLKRPHAVQNPHAADAEARMFQGNLRAVAIVRGQPRLLDDDPWHSPGIAAERTRHVMRARMQAALRDTRYGAVMIALALGDQAGVAREDWQVFNRTGITHLVSISGLHVTLVAGLAGAGVAWSWRRLRWRTHSLAERMPAQIAAIAAALSVAWLYCVLAGWGIPARRTFFTLAVAGAAAVLRMPLSTSRVLALAAAVVTALDPWAPVAPGFWLSFGAVAILLACAGGTQVRTAPDEPRWARIRRVLGGASRLQCVVTAALTPLLAYLTQQVSFVAPLANAVAIPAVSFVVTPLALLCAAFSAIPGAGRLAAWTGRAGQWVFEWCMAPVAWLAGLDWAARDVAAASAGLLVLALAGIAWALHPPAWPSRRYGWLLMLPVLCWRPMRPADGEWLLTALDVGQGAAIVVETARHTLVFDAGPLHRNGADAGQRMVWPYLRARGVRRVDTLVLSHADLDHAGGAGSLLRSVAVGRSYASFDVPAYLARDARLRGFGEPAPAPVQSRRCRAGIGWQADGVRFDFIHPQAGIGRVQRRNAAGCVLLIQGRHHAALLPGDIGMAQERNLLAVLPPVDVVLAPHHGSATSSGMPLVQAADAAHVIAQTGYLNRFRHPAPVVERRWRRAGATFWRTDLDGAVQAASTAHGLSVRAQRDARRRYWHAQYPGHETAADCCYGRNAVVKPR